MVCTATILVTFDKCEILSVSAFDKRNAREAARFKRMGVKAGVPDLFLPVSRGGCHGLFIELKAPHGRLSDHQRGWLESLKASGYAVSVCYGCDEARRDILRYLELEKQNRR